MAKPRKPIRESGISKDVVHSLAGKGPNIIQHQSEDFDYEDDTYDHAVRMGDSMPMASSPIVLGRGSGKRKVSSIDMEALAKHATSDSVVAAGDDDGFIAPALSSDRSLGSLISDQSSVSLHSDPSSVSLPSVDFSEDEKRKAILDIVFKTYFVQRISQIMVVATGRGGTPETGLTTGLNAAAGAISLVPIPLVDVGSIINAVNVVIQSRNKKKEVKSAANIIKCSLGDSEQFKTEPFREIAADLAAEVVDHCFSEVKSWDGLTPSVEKDKNREGTLLSRIRRRIPGFGGDKKTAFDVVYDVCDAIIESMESKEMSDIFDGLSNDHIAKVAGVRKDRAAYVKNGHSDPRKAIPSPRYSGIADEEVRKKVVGVLRGKLRKKWEAEGSLPSTSPSSPSIDSKKLGRGLSVRAVAGAKKFATMARKFAEPGTGAERQ